MEGSTIDDLAAHWAVRSEGTLSLEDSAALDAWLAADVRHMGAYARAKAVSINSHRLEALGQAALGEPLKSQLKPSRRSLVAASVVLGLSGAGIASAVMRGGQSYRTGLGEVKDYVLSDGTKMTLSALSSVSVRFDEDAREILMTEGEVLFDVAHDIRDFTVLTAGARIKVETGKVLLRRFAQDPLKVTALDHSIQVQSHEGAALNVQAQQRIALDAVPVAETIDEGAAQRALAWRDGRLALHDETLGEAARAFARFSTTSIVFDRAETAAKKLTGLFELRDPLTFARAAALSLNLGVLIGDKEIRLTSYDF